MSHANHKVFDTTLLIEGFTYSPGLLPPTITIVVRLRGETFSPIGFVFTVTTTHRAHLLEKTLSCSAGPSRSLRPCRDRSPFVPRHRAVLDVGHPHGPPVLFENTTPHSGDPGGFLVRCTFQHIRSETNCLTTEPRHTVSPGTASHRRSFSQTTRRPRSLARRSVPPL